MFYQSHTNCELIKETTMVMRSLIIFILFLLLTVTTGCQRPPEDTADKKVEKYGVLKTLPVDDMNGVIAVSMVRIDAETSYDGKGSFTITVEEPTTVNLYEVHDIDVEDARLLYQAKVRSRDLQGIAYIEMWVHLPDKGEYFTSNVHFPARGTTNWMSMEAPFFLKKGQNPDYVKLNLVIKGTGTVWIDDIKLAAAPLPESFK
jgi:hypothetical protein